MTEIDLIPQEYRKWLMQRSLSRKYLLGFGALNVAVIVAALLFGRISTSMAEEAARLTADNTVTRQQQEQLVLLQQQEVEIERQLGLLRGLRAGAAVDDIFAVVDRALNGTDLWFLDWKFRRAGVVVDGEQRGVETGYFVIVEDNNGAQADAWKIETHMTIHGQAKDHQALSNFVRALFEQGEIKDVNVQKTSATNFGRGRVVEFDLTIVLNSALREGR